MRVKKTINTGGIKVELNGKGHLIELISMRTTGSTKAMLGVSLFKSGFRSKNIVHDEDELVYVLEGEGKLITPEGEIKYSAGEALYIPAKTPHVVVNDSGSDLKMVYVFTYPEYPPTRVLD